MGLYIVGTPIGNLEDISYRAVKCLQMCDIIICEDTRISSRLLSKFDICKPLISYRDDNEVQMSGILLSKLQAGKNICLVSDAGMPCISDPGFRIVRACHKNNIKVSIIPGACAALSALVCSGLPSDGFLFLGFLPNKSAARVKVFEKYSNFDYSLIFYESCHRLLKFLEDASKVLEDTRCICIAKEITKIHERFFIGNLIDIKENLIKFPIKGEFVIIIAPKRFVI